MRVNEESDEEVDTPIEAKCSSSPAPDESRCGSIPSMEPRCSSTPLPTSVLKLYTKAAYSIGHVLNDLCASMWFTYLLLYFNYVKEFGPSLAGALLLVGQVADGLSTPFVGIESDRDDDFWLCKYGRRKTWHLLGTVCVLISFPILFTQCGICSGAEQYAQFIYYSVFVVIFQFGWAATQVSHLSLIPDLTPIPAERVSLNASRYAFTVASNILVYSITWAVLHIDGDGDTSHEQVGPSDAGSFQTVVLIVVAIGAVFSLIFHLIVSDPSKQADHLSHVESDLSELVLDKSLHLAWRDWFMESQFYIIGLLYMATRLYVNMSQVFIGLYIQDTLKLPKQNIAIVPLVMYVSGFIASFPINRVAKKLKLRTIYAFGIFLAVVGSIWIEFGDRTATFGRYEIYGVAVVIGVASTILLITSLSITNELIGVNTASGAFVFGAMSFLDKLSNGVVVIIIEDLHTCTNCHLDKENYYHNVMVYALGGSAILGLVAVIILARTQVSTRRKDLMNRTPNLSYASLPAALLQECNERTRLVEDN